MFPEQQLLFLNPFVGRLCSAFLSNKMRVSSLNGPTQAVGFR